MSTPHFPTPARLTVIYDEQCELCRRCRHWLATQPTHIELRFLACGDPRVTEIYEDFPFFRVELMVVTDAGQAWIGPEAFLMCLWATRRWRSTSFRLKGTAFSPLVERFFHALSDNRGTISGMLSTHTCDGESCVATSEPAAQRSVALRRVYDYAVQEDVFLAIDD